jgi:DNA repair exonuclease SbcCD ATPase subunit
LDDAAHQRASFVAPDQTTLAALRAALGRRAEAEIMLNAALVTLVIEPLRSLEARVLAAEDATPAGEHRSLASGQSLELRGEREVAVELEGLARIRATGPSGSVEELKQAHRDADDEIERLTRGFATRDIAELDQLRVQALELDGRIKGLKQRIRDLLGGRAREVVQTELAKTENAIEEILRRRPPWRAQAPDADALRRDADAAAGAIAEQVETVEAELDQARDADSREQIKLTELTTEIRGAESAADSAEKRIASLTADGLDDVGRQELRREAALRHEGAVARLEQIQKALAAFAGDPREEVQTLRKQCESCREEVHRQDKNLLAVQKDLAAILAESPYSRLAAAEERVQRLSEDAARERLHLQAVKLLYETVVATKSTVVGTLLGPVRSRAEQTLKRIAGGRFGRIEFDDTSFLPRGVAPSVQEEAVVLDYLSGGEQEQIHFAVRLALADVAFSDQRQLVVLDDAFTATDTGRMARIVKILDEASDRFQIVLLSCHPERYSHLTHAKFFDLQELTKAAAGSS